MGMYKFSAIWQLQFGVSLNIDLEYKIIQFDLPFIRMTYGYDDHAKGVSLFGKGE